MRSLAGLLIACACIGVAGAQPEVDSIFRRITDRKSPGVAVLVLKRGKTIIQRGYGVRELRTMAPIDEKTDFRLASFTKQFTAMAAMLLVHDGKLRYDEPLTRFFPDFPAYGRAITVRHLLTHTSGVPDYEDLMEGGPWTEARQIQDAEVLELLKRPATPKFAAGTSWAYSNSGYVLLGLMVAKVSGVPFGDFLRERIFQPLHMGNTLVYVKGRNAIPNRAFGHTKRAEGFVETDQSSTSATQGDGGIYSNLEDLVRWDQAMDDHALLSEAEMKPALAPVRLADGSNTRWPTEPGGDNLNPGQPVAYGFGWFLDPYAGRARMWHSGNTRGFSTVIERFTAEKLTVVVLCNRTDLDASGLALRVADVLPTFCGDPARPGEVGYTSDMRRIATALIVSMLPSLAQNGSPFIGRWDFNITTPRGTGAAWLGISEKNGGLSVWYQPTGGNVYELKDVKVVGDHLVLGISQGGNRPAVTWDLEARGGQLVGVQKRGDASMPLTGVRAPELKRPEPKAWTAPEALFNGKNLDGWEPIGDPKNSHWTVKDGLLVNEARGANLRSVRKFDDIKLHFEVFCPENANSGFYLRGRYEVQIESEPLAENPPERRIGSIYGRLTPKEVPRKSGVWDTFDVTLVGRSVTIVRNGVTTIDHQEIEGITGGALDANEGEPGPFYIQGDHTGGLKFRNITVAVPKK